MIRITINFCEHIDQDRFLRGLEAVFPGIPFDIKSNGLTMVILYDPDKIGIRQQQEFIIWLNGFKAASLANSTLDHVV